MSRVVVVEPVARVEGEARVVVLLDERNGVRDVYYQTIEIRGFEAFCRGRHAEEMPRISQMICGVCSVAHHLASAKAVDALFGRKPTEAAVKIRELVYNIHMIDDHLLHLAIMALPDILPETSAEAKGIAGVFKSNPEIVKNLVKARSITTSILRRVGGRLIHIPIAVPGGVSKKLSREDLEFIEARLKELKSYLEYSLDLFKSCVSKSERLRNLMHSEEYTLRTYYMGLVGEDGSPAFYDGVLRVIDSKGREVATFKPAEYTKYIAERHEDWCYSKFTYLAKTGWQGFREEAVVRVGPLARLNVSSKIPTPWAREEFKSMLDFFGGTSPVHSTLAYHWARLVENVYAFENASKIVGEHADLLMSGDVVNLKGEPAYEGVGIVEAARGILVHHYKADQNYLVTDVNVITPTAINSAAINTQLKKIASRAAEGVLSDAHLQELVDRFEVAIRAYDPCNSCATHTVGSRLVKVLVYDSNGNLVRVIS